MSERERCARQGHSWLAFFLESGRLAYWQCEVCGLVDREIGVLPEPLDEINSWIDSPPTLRAQGRRPPQSTRRWATAAGGVLAEGEPSSTHFVGLPIPGLAEAHSYVDYDAEGRVRHVYEPARECGASWSSHCTLTRYQVVGDELIEFAIHCFEESTLDTPHAGEPRRRAVLSGLVSLDLAPDGAD